MGTLREYEAYWEKLKPGYCRPYVKEDMPPLEAWPIYSGNIQHYRAYDLYNKYLHYAVMDNGDGLYYAAGSYSDSAHEMNIELEYDTGTDGFIERMETELYTGGAAELFCSFGETEKIQKYVVETKIYLYPLPLSVRQEFPEYGDAAFALKYHIYSVISTIEIMLDRFNMRERTDVPQPDPNIPEKYY